MYSLRGAKIIFTTIGKIIFGGKTIHDVKSIDLTNNCISILNSNNSLAVWDNTSNLNIQIIGNIQSVEANDCDIRVEGNCNNIKTSSGDVQANTINGPVETKSGDIRVISGNIIGNVKTMSGDVTAKNIHGSVQTTSGDINNA